MHPSGSYSTGGHEDLCQVACPVPGGLIDTSPTVIPNRLELSLDDCLPGHGKRSKLRYEYLSDGYELCPGKNSNRSSY